MTWGLFFHHAFSWLSTGVMIIPTRTMHYYQGNPLHCLIPPKWVIKWSLFFNIQKHPLFQVPGALQILPSGSSTSSRSSHNPPKKIHVASWRIRATNLCFMVSPFASMTSHAWNAGWGWMMGPLFLAKTTFLTNITRILSKNNPASLHLKIDGFWKTYCWWKESG